jgi:hypothetical protein
MVAAGILPAVVPGFQPGGKSVENIWHCSGRQDAALHGRQDACHHIFQTRLKEIPNHEIRKCQISGDAALALELRHSVVIRVSSSAI